MTDPESGWKASVDHVVSDFDQVTRHLRRRQGQALRVAWGAVVATAMAIGALIILTLRPPTLPATGALGSSSVIPAPLAVVPPSALDPSPALPGFGLLPGDPAIPRTPATPTIRTTSSRPSPAPAPAPDPVPHHPAPAPQTLAPVVSTVPVTVAAPSPAPAPTPSPEPQGLVDGLLNSILHPAG